MKEESDWDRPGNPWRDKVCENCGGCNLSCSFNIGADCVCRDCGGNEIQKDEFIKSLEVK